MTHRCIQDPNKAEKKIFRECRVEIHGEGGRPSLKMGVMYITSYWLTLNPTHGQ